MQAKNAFLPRSASKQSHFLSRAYPPSRILCFHNRTAVLFCQLPFWPFSPKVPLASLFWRKSQKAFKSPSAASFEMGITMLYVFASGQETRASRLCLTF